MDDYCAYTHDVIRRLTDAFDQVSTAASRLHQEPPPWPGVEQAISNAASALHVARVSLAAARVAYARALHNATVAKNYDSSDQADDEQLPGPDSPVTGEF